MDGIARGLEAAKVKFPRQEIVADDGANCVERNGKAAAILIERSFHIGTDALCH